MTTYQREKGWGRGEGGGGGAEVGFWELSETFYKIAPLGVLSPGFLLWDS